MPEETAREPQSGEAPATPECGLGTPSELRYPGFWILFLLSTSVGAATSVRHYFEPSLKPTTLQLAGFVACVVYLYPWIGLTPLVFRLERRLPLGTGCWARNLSLLGLASVPICLAVSPLMLAVAYLVFLAFGAPAPPPRSPLSVFGLFPIAQALYWGSVAGGYAIRTRFRLHEQERRTARLALEKSRLEASLNQVQLEVLRARLNPHFLFNSLQNISVMTGENPVTASRMLSQLGDLLRAVLRQDSRPEITLREEAELTRSYVALEQIRFGERLEVHFDMAPDTQAALVPSFLLQPLVENAVVHGLRGARKTGIITVSATADAHNLVLTVTDNGIGPPPSSGTELKIGVGLGSTCERLARMYPDRHTFSIRRPPQGGAEVRITIPVRFAEEGRLPHDEHAALAGR